MSTAATTSGLRYRLIRTAFLNTDQTFADVARHLQTSRSMITHVAKGRRVSRRVRNALARALGMSYRKLWEE